MSGTRGLLLGFTFRSLYIERFKKTEDSKLTMLENNTKGLSRIQRERRAEILESALGVFSLNGFRGASINEIAKAAKMSTPRLLYHFSDKQQLYTELLKETLRLWLDPLEKIEDSDDPVSEISAYIRRKLYISQKYPRESRLFAGAILFGVQRTTSEVFDPLRHVFEEKIKLVEHWKARGLIPQLDAHHLMYSIWATTQHYADFEAQISELSPDKLPTLYDDAEAYLVPMYRKLLVP